LADIITG